MLVARLSIEQAEATGAAGFLVSDATPFQKLDPIDFPDADLARVFALYRETYAAIAGAGGRFNIGDPNALFEFDRFVLFVDDAGEIVGFVLAKTTRFGIKLCLTGHDGRRGKTIILFHIDALNNDEVYAEISQPIESRIGGEVPHVPAAKVSRILGGKPISPQKDREHYTREIANVGVVTKLVVGRPRKTPRK